jgi:RimJ/RimL family protein N-acetyltransferase
MNIRGEKVIIRAIESDDLNFLREMINSEELEATENGFVFPVSMQQQSKWFDNLNQTDQLNQRMIIEYESKAVGYLSLVNIDWKNRVAHVGIKLLLKEYRRKGIGTDSIKAIEKFCFMELNLNRLESFILEDNIASQKLFIEKCRWVQEGRKRQYVYKNGKYKDLIIVGFLKDDYIRYEGGSDAKL